MVPAPSSARPASTGALPGIRWPLDLVRVFTHGRRTGPCAIARAPGPTAKALVSLQTAEHYVAVEALAARWPRTAVMLKRIAEMWDRYAQREDEEAERDKARFG